MRGTGMELACFYWVAPPGHRLAFLGHHHERDRRAEAPFTQNDTKKEMEIEQECYGEPPI